MEMDVTHKYQNLKDELNLLRQKRAIEFFEPYEWQLKFINASKDNAQITAMAGNRVGKTYSAGSFLSYNLTGQYPKWYKGIKFKHAISCVACGISGDQIRDVIQSVLIGEVDTKRKHFGGHGLIPVDLIVDAIPSLTHRNLLKEVHIRHISGGISKILFRSYEQGRGVMQGPSRDIVWIDEEPRFEPMEFYGECLARTLTGNNGKGGLTVLTFTPENGLTPLVNHLLNNKSEGQYLTQVTWDEAPHLSDTAKKQLLKAIPSHLIDAKTKGIPSFGDNQVFMTNEDFIKCKDFEIPEHFRILCGIDFGHAHPFAAVFVAYDADKDIIYVYDCFKVKREVPTQHTHRINSKLNKIRCIYPHDAESAQKGSGDTLKTLYVSAGLNMYQPFKNPDGSIYVEPGLLEMETRMREGRFKVFESLTEWFKEYRIYHRKNGKIVKNNDDIIDATRYASIMVQRYGQRKCDVGKSYVGKLYVERDL
jgi:phage terminase large subunit-like protein